MGCGTPHNQTFTLETLTFRTKKKDLVITPSTFVKLSTSSRLAEYKKLKQIGSGSFSEVYLCRHLPTGTKRALKAVRKSSLTSRYRDRTMLVKEIQILKELDHPNILKCFEIFEDDYKYFISTEYCSRGDLFLSIINLKNFSEEKAAKIMFQILSGIYYCHSNKVTHRDLKPENIFLLENEKDFVIKIGDFGSSTNFDREELNGCCGSSYYIAPEMISGLYNEKVDIWSIGILMYVMLTGVTPYNGKTESEILTEIQEHPFQVNLRNTKNISRDARTLLSRMLVTNPSLRITAGDALKSPWIQKSRNLDSDSLSISLDSLRLFHRESKLREAVSIYIYSQVATHEELRDLKQHFQVLDKDGDGKISKNEFLEEYTKVMGFSNASLVVEKICTELDQNSDGNVDFSEFLLGCRTELKTVVLRNLEAAFRMLDLNGDGFITVEEIKGVLGSGKMTEEKIWVDMIKEADMNKDGKIDLGEFLKVMSNLSCF